MKKLFIVSALVAGLCSTTAMAQQERAAGSGASGAAIGGIATGTIVAGAVAAGVLAAVISNNRSSSSGIDEEVATCNANDGAPVNGVCTGTTVTVSGTTTVPVTFTYPAIVQ